jgi:hypothetical protein
MSEKRLKQLEDVSAPHEKHPSVLSLGEELTEACAEIRRLQKERERFYDLYIKASKTNEQRLT